MPYSPTIPPIELEEWRRWLEDELNRLNGDVITGQDFYGFKIHYAEPTKYELGQVVYADGTTWNPGAGQGLYERTNLGWAKLGGGDGNVVPTSHAALQDLLADDHPQYHTDARGDIRYYTKAVVDAHTTDAAKHRLINDAGTLTTELFSASKIISDLSTKSDIVHTHVKTDITDFNEADYATGAEGDLATSALQDITGELIGDLSDVTITTVANGQVLTYNAGVWENADATAGAQAIDDLTDVTITAAQADQVLTFNGSIWENADSTGNGAQAIDDLTDVTITTAELDQVLTFNGSIWENATPVVPISGIYVAPVVTASTDALDDVPVIQLAPAAPTGVGETFVINRITPTIDIDGYVATIGDRLLFKNASIYELTDVGINQLGVSRGIYNYTSVDGPLPGTPEVYTIAVLSGSADSKWFAQIGRYFSFSSPTTDYYVWIRRDGVGTDPLVAGQTSLGPLDIVSADNLTAVQVADLLKIVINTGPFTTADNPYMDVPSTIDIINNAIDPTFKIVDFSGFLNPSSSSAIRIEQRNDTRGTYNNNYQFTFTRDTEYDEENEVIPGHTVYVENGILSGTSTYVLNTFETIIPGTTQLTYVEINAGLIIDGGGA